MHVGAGGDHHRPDREPVEPVGQVHRVRRADEHERRERQVEEPEVRPCTFLKNGNATVGWNSRHREQQAVAPSVADRALREELVARARGRRSCRSGTCGSRRRSRSRRTRASPGAGARCRGSSDRRAARSTSTSENRISVPPMVGVPAFTLWRSGPSLRMGCPIWFSVSRRITTGPSRNEIESAVSAASRRAKGDVAEDVEDVYVVCSE